MAKSEVPFTEAVESLEKRFNLPEIDAIDRVDNKYAKFKDRTKAHIERQDDQGNAVSIQLVSHVTVLASLLITVTGLLLTQTLRVDAEPLLPIHKVLILIVFLFEGASIVFGAIEYVVTIRFHREWAKLYQAVDREVDQKTSDGTLQWTSQLGEIEEAQTSTGPERSPIWVSWAMMGCCAAGMVVLFFLFVFFFFG